MPFSVLSEQCQGIFQGSLWQPTGVRVGAEDWLGTMVVAQRGMVPRLGGGCAGCEQRLEQMD